MTNIYEALERAGKERAEPENRQPGWRGEGDDFMITDRGLNATLIGLYQNILALLPNHQTRIVQFTGVSQGEGTTPLVREFARVLGLAKKKRVLLLDANQKRPSLAHSLGIVSKLSWQDAVKNRVPLGDVLYQVGDTTFFVSQVSSNGAGQVTVDLDSSGVDVFFEELRPEFDLILIDSPPAKFSPDSLLLSKKVDGAVLVVEAEKTRWQVAETAKQQIERQGGRILGVILNKRRYHIPKRIYDII